MKSVLHSFEQMGLTVRRASESDLEAAKEIAARAWVPANKEARRALGWMYDAMHPDWVSEKKEQLDSAFHNSASDFYVVCEDDGPIAFLTLNFSEVTGEIGNNAVDPRYAGRGIGTLMYRFAFEVMKKRGMKVAKVFTGGDASHAPARKAYEKAGFEVKTEHVIYYKGLDENE